jgi:hypothetical protein
MTFYGKWMSVAAGLLLAGLIFAAGVAAQEGTPVASPATEATPIPAELVAWSVGDPVAPAASQCTAAPASTDDVAASLLELESRRTPALTANGVIAIPAVGPADQPAIDGVLATLMQFWACNNAGQRAALVSTLTPQGIAELYNLDLSAGEEAVRAGVAAALTPGEAREAGDVASIDGIPSVVNLDDGRIAALVLNTDPAIADGDQVLDLFIFIEQDGTYLVDSFVGDPFDMTPGYGFEAE